MPKLSPHVSIYKFPITAISSITNRMSGLVLSGMYVTSGISCLIGIDDNIKEEYTKLENKELLHYSILFPCVYHTLGSIRHFIWDKYPSLLTNSSVQKSSFLLFTGSFISTYVVENHLNNIKKTNIK
jgi:succinate dehydrogenase (ubiquinone) cytochrome b560 subunit